ncbi:hypothetical protein COLO4_32930 [Corchorus olitorius]|uniref:Uncharacterized protein n=1 Tax=Corchorus olitorius TaxID=93759 RepID=A0A1R3GX68_9ROSI|nr:hypothetical protein COLO4_32930 [Corchorus olitorius]
MGSSFCVFLLVSFLCGHEGVSGEEIREEKSGADKLGLLRSNKKVAELARNLGKPPLPLTT